MKMKELLFSAMLVLMGTGAANAQKAYTYVKQGSEKLTQLGTAAFDVSPTSQQLSMSFDENGNAVMKKGDNIVAKLPMKDSGMLVVEFETTVAQGDLNKVTKTFSNPYATLYSPFQLQVTGNSAVEVHVPTYNAENQSVKCNSTTKVAANEVIPCETALLLKNAGTVNFTISDGAATVTSTSALSGSSLRISKPNSNVYTLGHKTDDESQYGFFLYTGTTLNPGLAWLEPTSGSSEAKYYAISLDEGETTGISESTSLGSQPWEGKYIENGRVVIVKNGKKYNLNGQEVK